jgi:transposase
LRPYAKKNVVFGLLNGLKPESKTICNFRKDNAENLKRFFREFAKKLANDDLIGGKIIKIDGAKIRANNVGN